MTGIGSSPELPASALSAASISPPPRNRWRAATAGEDGMTTAEYAVGTVVACGFAGVLWAVVHSGAVSHLLQATVERALSMSF